MGGALDGAPPASVVSRTAFDLERSDVGHRGAVPPSSSVVSCTQGSQNEPLTLPVAPWDTATSRRGPRCQSSLVPTPSSRSVGSSSPKRLLSTSAVVRLAAPRQPATDPAVLPLRSSFRRSFAPRLPCTERLDPSSIPAALRVGGRQAARRLSISAIDSVHEHNHEPAEPRRTSPKEALRCSWFALPPSGGTATADGSAPCGAQPAEMARVRDLGRDAKDTASALATAIARGGDFAPTRLARTPHVAARAGMRVGEPDPVAKSLVQMAAVHAPPGAPRAVCLEGRLTRPPAKGSTFRRTRGAFRPSVGSQWDPARCP